MIMIFALLLISIACHFIDAATFSIAYFTSGVAQLSFRIVVDGVATTVTYATASQYYNFDYEIGQSLKLYTLPSGGNYVAYYLIKNGPDGTGKTIYDSKAETFFLINQCPASQQQCRLALSSSTMTGATADVFLNEALALANYSGGNTEIVVKSTDVIKVVVKGSPAAGAKIRFDTNNINDNTRYGEGLFWIYDYLVTGALIETAAITSPKDGEIIYANPAGRNIKVMLSSTPLPALYNVKVECDAYPPFTKMILSNTAIEQSITIPPNYQPSECVLSIIDTISGLNTVFVLIPTVEIKSFLQSLGFGSNYMRFNNLNQTRI